MKTIMIFIIMVTVMGIFLILDRDKSVRNEVVNRIEKVYEAVVK